MRQLLLLLFLLSLFSCGQAPKPVPLSSESSLGTVSCSPAEYDPQNISELLTMIDKLPKPLELECVLRSLKRPFAVYATASKMSVQPALSRKDPRIFIFKGNLVLSFATAGEGSLTLEFSEFKNDVRSIKGELKIPVVSNFKPADAFSQIINATQTSCSACHTSEQAEYLVGGVQVYSSRPLKPTASFKVTLAELEAENYLCQAKQDRSRRCAIYSALLSKGQVTDREFPEDTPTLLDAFIK